MRSLLSALFLASALGAIGLTSASCALYNAPPEPSIDGLDNGLLTDANAPFDIVFTEPVDPATLVVQIARFEPDIEGNLADEDADPDSDLDLLFLYTPQGSMVGGKAEFLDNNARFRIHMNAPMPIGPKLVALIDPGLKDKDGVTTTARRRLLFGYTYKLDCDKPSEVFPTGGYFMLADIKAPIKTQVQLWAWFDVDPKTGRVNGQCTNADRDPDPSRCKAVACKSPEVCRTLPQEACVVPSERAGTIDEYPDYIPNQTPPTGFTFTVDGCAVDQPDMGAVFVTAPADVIVQSPPVTLRNVKLTAQLSRDMGGVLRGSGSLTADSVLLGTTSSGKGEGSITLLLAPDASVPKDIPRPPPLTP